MTDRGDELVVRAERVAAGGDAIAREPGGRIVFVAGAIPGELVRVRVIQAKRDFVRARLLTVEEASPDRVVPPCPYLHTDPACGGCSWQHVTVERQRALKRAIAVDALRRLGRLDPDHLDATVVEGPPLPGGRFRTTVRMAVGPDGRLGFRTAKGHDVVSIDDCLVVHPGVVETATSVRASGIDEMVLRMGARTGERSAWWDGAGSVRGLAADVSVGEDAHITEIVGGIRLRVSARSFFQSSPEAAEALVATVTELGGEGDGPVIDAYGGVGLFASAVATHRAVTSIEAAPSSCADARVNLADRDAVVVETPVEDWTPTPATLVIADPAREGLGADAAAVLAATGAERFVLVSCDAAAAGRDVAALVGAGYAHRRSVVLDPFPHTAHVEIVTLLTR